MGKEGGTDLALEAFAGLITDFPASQLPAGSSPDTQDTAFGQNGVKTRPGLGSTVFTPIAGSPAVNYLKTYIPQTLSLRMLALDSLGNVWKENPIGTLSNVYSSITAPYCTSTSQFTREYMAFGTGQYGLDLPRQYDDTNFDRVSQCGPGAPPNAADENVVLIIAAGPNGATQPAAVAIVAGPVGATESGFIVTITNAAPHLLSAGQHVVVAGVGVAGYNNGGANPAFFTVLTTPSATTFTYQVGSSGLAASGGGTSSSCVATYQTTTPHGFALNQGIAVAGVGVAGYNVTQAVAAIPDATHFQFNLNVSGLLASGAGTATPIGSIIAGVHKLIVIFVTRQGYQTQPSSQGSWTSTGAKRVALSNIPTGPPNIVARIIAFTSSGGANFFYTGSGSPFFSGNMVISDNTTTSATMDFSDIVLLAGTNVDALFRQIELGECSSVTGYSSRLFWVGERNKITNFNNITFDGGFSGNFPFGWIPDAANSAGGSSAVAGAQPVVWGDAYAITGDGVTVIRGQINQTAFQDSTGVPILLPNTAYSVRARISRNATLVAGTIHVNLKSVSGAFTTTGIAMAAGALTTSYVEFIATILTSQASIPSDLMLQVFADGIPTNGGIFLIDCIELFPTNQPFNSSLVRASLSSNPEAYDGISGFMQVSENDGTRCTSLLSDQLRGFLYIAKEHSVWSTTDDGVHEPSLWTLTQVSKKVGTPSPRGLSFGEDWFVIAHRTGLFISDGGEPIKISQEIQPTWNQINWQFGHTLWVTVDTTNKRILVGVPFGESQRPNRVLQMDYRGLDSAATIAETPCVHFSSYTGKLIARGNGRKWSLWNITANSCALIERPDGTAHVFFGNGIGNGRIYDLLDANLTDDGSAIPSYYVTYFFPSIEQEQALQMTADRKLVTYLTGAATGSGTMVLSAFGPNNALTYALPSILLSAAPLRDFGFNVNIIGERVSFKIATGLSPGDWFSLTKFCPKMRTAAFMPLAGVV